MKKLIKRLTSALVLSALIATSMPAGSLPAAAAPSETARMREDMKKAIEESLAKESPELSAEYPNGIFSFATLNAGVEETNKDPLTVFLVRHGGAEGTKKVHIKLADYSAEYGKDYTVRLDDGFFSKPIEKNEDSRPILYQFTDEESGNDLPDPEGLKEAYGDEAAEEIISLLKEEAEAQGDAEAPGSAGTPQGSDTQRDAQSPASAGTPRGTDAQSSGSVETAPAAKAEPGADTGAESPLAGLNDDVSRFSGQGSPLDLKVVDMDEDQQASADRNARLLDLMIPGTEGDVVFGEGERIKEIFVYPVDNKVSDGDRVFEIRIDTEQEDRIPWQTGENSAAVTIHDDEPDEQAVITVSSEETSLSEDRTFTVALSRQDGLYKVSSVDYQVSDERSGKRIQSGKAVFMPGMDERTVRLSLGNLTKGSPDELLFTLKDPVGAVLGDRTTASLSLRDYKDAHGDELLEAVGTDYSKSDPDNPFGLDGTQYDSYFDVSLNTNNFDLSKHNNEADDYVAEITSGGVLHLEVPDDTCSATGQAGFAVLNTKLHPVLMEKISFKWLHNDWEGSTCNKVYIAFKDCDYGWNDSQDYVLAAEGDQNDGKNESANWSHVSLVDGSAGDVDHKTDYNNDYLNYSKKFDGNEEKKKSDEPFCFGVKKTSKAWNGMNLEVSGFHLDFRKYNVTIVQSGPLPGHTESPGFFTFDKDETSRSVYGYSTVAFKSNNTMNYAYLKGLQVSKDGSSNGTWYDLSSSCFDRETMQLRLDMNFVREAYKAMDYSGAKFYVRPVYEQLTVPLRIVADSHGGVEVLDQGNTSLAKVSRSSEQTVQVKVGQNITARSYDVEQGTNETWNLTKFVMTPTKINGGGSEDQYYADYPQDPAVMSIANCNYTLTPVYTSTGTTVNIKFDGPVPEGCGLKEKVRDDQGNTVNKTTYTYKDDHIRAGQIMQIDALAADGYDAKWTINTPGHKDHLVTCYGDTFYFKIMTPQSEIRLSFVQMEKPGYTRISGKTCMYDGSIINPPAQDETGKWLSDYVPIPNVSVQMGAFSGLSVDSGGFVLYTHTEAQEGSSGQNVTTYLRTDMARTNETRALKVIHNGVQQVVYFPVVKPAPSGEEGKAAETPLNTQGDSITVDFYGRGPIPVDYYTLLGNTGVDEIPSMIQRSPTIALYDYDIGLHVDLSQVLGEQDESGNRKDLVDHVVFSVYDRKGIRKRSYSVKREKPGQTVYELKTYEGQDADGEPAVMYFNGLVDFVDGDQIYVEIIGKVMDDEGNEADYSYGLYRTGVCFMQVPGEGMNIAFPDVGASKSGGIPTLDVLGTMLPALNFGKFTVNAQIDSKSMIINVGFNVAQLNKSLYDSKEAERASQAASVKEDIDETQDRIDDEKKTKEDAEAVINEITKIPEDQRTDEQKAELALQQGIVDECDQAINDLNADLNDLNSRYEQLGGTTEPVPQEDPLKPVGNDEASDQVNMTEDFTADEIDNANKTADNVFSKGEAGMDPLNPFGNPVRDKVNQMEKQAKKLGLGDSKGKGVSGSGSISFSLSLQLGITCRFKVKTNKETGMGEWIFDYAMVYANVTGGVTGMYYMVFPEFPIPLYAGASITGSIGLYAGITTVGATTITIDEFDEGEYDSDKILLDGMVPVTIGLEGFVGAGLRNLLCLEMGLGFLQKFNFSTYVEPLEFDYVHATGVGKTSFYGYLSTTMLIFSYKWRFLQLNWDYSLYDTYAGDLDSGLSPIGAMDPGDASLGEFAIEDRVPMHYYGTDAEPESPAEDDRLRNAGSGSSSGGGSARDILGDTGSGLKWDGTTGIADGLSDTISEVVSLGNGAWLTVFEGELAEEDFTPAINAENYKFNRRAIYLTWYDGTDKITRILQKDGTNDSSLHVDDLGDEIVISFASANKTFDRDDLLKSDGTVRPDGVVELLGSMDMYAAVLKKSEVKAFVEASPESRLGRIERLSNDQENAKDTSISANLASGAKYLGYGYENGQAVEIGDQIYLFYTAVDYNQWRGREAVEDLSGIVDAKGYELYRIYDRTTRKWTDTYAKDRLLKTYKERGIDAGVRLADVHLTSGSGAATLPMIGELDAARVHVFDEDRLILAYLVEGDQSLANNNAEGNDPSRVLFFSFVKPAKIEDGKVVEEPEWSVPLQWNTEYAEYSRPGFEYLRNGDREELYFLVGRGDDLCYVNLSEIFNTVYDPETGTSYQLLGKRRQKLMDGSDADSFTLNEKTGLSVAVKGDPEGGFSLKNGYRVCADSNGHFYVVWSQSVGNSQKLYISTMSEIAEKPAGGTGQEGDGSAEPSYRSVWSVPHEMDWDQADPDGRIYLTNPSIAVDENGDMLIAHNSYELELVKEINGEGKEVAAGKKHVNDRFNMTGRKASGSAVVSDLFLSQTYPRAGETFSVTGVVTNNGLLKADEIRVTAELVARSKGGALTILESSRGISLYDRLPDSREGVAVSFEMKQEYLDKALNEGAVLFARMTAKEVGFEGDAVSATVDLSVGPHFVFRDARAEGILTKEGKTRYVVRTKLKNEGNVDATDTVYSMAVSNENRFAVDDEAFEGGGIKNGTDPEKVKEALSRGDATVARNPAFRDWLKTNSFLLDDDEVGNIGVGEEITVRLVSAQIPGKCFSKNGCLSLAVAASDKSLSANESVESRNAVVLSVTEAESETPSLRIFRGDEYGDYNADDEKSAGTAGEDGVVPTSISMKNGETVKLRAEIMPVKEALNYHVNWASENETVAVVDQEGNVTAKKKGEALITASVQVLGGKTIKAACILTVEEAVDGLIVNGLAGGFTYTGSAIKPQVTVFFGKKESDGSFKKVRLTEGRDYKLSYKNNKNAASADSGKKAPVVRVKLKGEYKKYKGPNAFNFTIKPVIMNSSGITANNISALVKTVKKKGTEGYKRQELVPAVFFNGKALRKKKDFTLTYPYVGEDSETSVAGDQGSGAAAPGADPYAAPGSYEVVIKGTGNFIGTVRVNEILTEKGDKVPLSGAKVRCLDEIKAYDPKNPTEQEPKYELSVRVGGKDVILSPETDYEVTYSGNTLPGKAAVTFTAREGSALCYGSKKTSFRIRK